MDAPHETIWGVYRQFNRELDIPREIEHPLLARAGIHASVHTRDEHPVLLLSVPRAQFHFRKFLRVFAPEHEPEADGGVVEAPTEKPDANTRKHAIFSAPSLNLYGMKQDPNEAAVVPEVTHRTAAHELGEQVRLSGPDPSNPRMRKDVFRVEPGLDGKSRGIIRIALCHWEDEHAMREVIALLFDENHFTLKPAQRKEPPRLPRADEPGIDLNEPPGD